MVATSAYGHYAGKLITMSVGDSDGVVATGTES